MFDFEDGVDKLKQAPPNTKQFLFKVSFFKKIIILSDKFLFITQWAFDDAEGNSRAQKQMGGMRLWNLFGIYVKNHHKIVRT